MNPLNPKWRHLTLILGVFLAFLIIIAPDIARAQDDCDTTPVGDPSTAQDVVGAYQDRYLHNVHNAIHRVSQIKQHWLDPKNLKLVDAKADYCVKLINDALNTMALYTHVGFKGLIIQALFLIIDGLLTSVIEAVCDIAGRIISTAVSLFSILSRLCLPLPTIHVPGFAFSWGLGNCRNGIPLLTLGPLNPPNQKESPSSWQLWNGRVQLGP